MKGKVISDWSLVKYGDRKSRKQVVGALQHFMRAPMDKNGPIYKAIQAFATKGDFPAEILSVLEKYHAVPNYDMGYERTIDIRDFTGSGQSGFDILSVESGLTFAEVPLGEKAKVYKVSGDKVRVEFGRYAGGLNWDRILIDDKQYWQLEDNAIEFRNKAYASRASHFYALIEAAGALNTEAWAAVDGSIANTNDNYQAIRDSNTINSAILGIVTTTKDKGYGVTPQSRFVITAPLALRPRIEKALSFINQPVVGSPRRVQYNIEVVYTLMLSATDKYYVALPGVKNKGGYRMDVTLFDQFDMLAYADTVVGWMRHGGAIGDTDQIKQCAVA